MALDSFCIRALAQELRAALADARIDKIQQPERDVFLFHLRLAGPGRGNRKLLLSAGSGSARVHLTEISRENPQTPPMFCMLLRKHLTGARIADIVQPERERMLVLELDTMSELGETRREQLIVEMMGRNSNLIFCGSDGRILDCLRKVDAEMSPQRQVLPGMFYRMPPRQERPDPLRLSPEDWRAALEAAPGKKALDAWLNQTFSGLSPLVSRELAFRACGGLPVVADIGAETPARLHAALCELDADPHVPVLLLREGKPWDVCSFLPLQYGGGEIEARREESFSALLDRFYTGRERAERTRQRAQALLKAVHSRRERTARKLAAQRQELTATYDRERLREQGDILKANLYRMERGASVLRAENFYAPDNAPIEIALDPRLSPQQNAARYYKAYSKAKNAERVLSEQLEQGEKELDYLDSVLEEIQRAEGERDLREIRAELLEQGYIREKRAAKAPKRAESAPMQFVSGTGLRILVGRNNLQNDRLTLRLAQRSDTWLHTQKIHGSHVVICGAPDEQTLYEAASLAALYSKASEGRNVPVDYTLVRYVKKPGGAKPGMVIYTDYKTLYVNPDPTLAEQLKIK